jgi:hypothetical protein
MVEQFFEIAVSAGARETASFQTRLRAADCRPLPAAIVTSRRPLPD